MCVFLEPGDRFYMRPLTLHSPGSLLRTVITGNSTSESRHEQFPFPSLDLSKLLLQPELWVSKPKPSLSEAQEGPL